jgi:hypothetical protein
MSRELHALTAFEKIINAQREFLVKNRNEDILHRYKEMEKDRKRAKSAKNVLDIICREGNADRIVKATDRFLELIEKRALTLEKKPNGTYKIKATK